MSHDQILISDRLIQISEHLVMYPNEVEVSSIFEVLFANKCNLYIYVINIKSHIFSIINRINR